jgi:hypothetical protein
MIRVSVHPRRAFVLLSSTEYLTNIRMPSLTSNHHESSLRISLVLFLRAGNPIINNVAILGDLSEATLSPTCGPFAENGVLTT